ncbi:MAG: hypothetical protein AB1640_08875 [bacterium]
MTLAFKAALVSGVVFPGAGQILLRRQGRGILIMAAVLAGLAVIARTAARTAIAVMQQIDLENTVIDTAALVRLAVESSHQAASTYAGSLVWVVGLWIFSVLDAYRLGRLSREREGC